MMPMNLDEISLELLAVLRKAGDEWGPMGVALAAAALTDRDALVKRLTGEPMKTNPNKLVGEFDASKWAETFVATVAKKPSIATDQGTMLGWFANAIAAGYDHARNKPAPTPEAWMAGITDDTPCFIRGCDYTDIDERGPICLRYDTTHYYACTEHWEAIVGTLGRQVRSDDEDRPNGPNDIVGWVDPETLCDAED